MREILFHGKRKDNYEWIEGAYCFDGRKHFIIEFICEQIVNWHEVYAETVGQFTGLCDKNGKRIFEGDILQIRNTPYSEKPFSSFVIAYGDYCVVDLSNIEIVGFYLYWTSDKEAYRKLPNLKWWFEEREAVCIGNIHDNPELWKGGE